MKKLNLLLIFFMMFLPTILLSITAKCETQQYEEFAITVFTKEISNGDHPAIKEFDIPNKPIESCFLQIEVYLDSDDVYLRAVHFFFDNIGGPIGCNRIAPGQVGGDTFSPGDTVNFEYDMSNVDFAAEPPDTGSVNQDFIPQSSSDIVGFLSPGNHTIKAYVSSDDGASGITNESWISITLVFNKPSMDIVFYIIAGIVAAISAILGIAAYYKYRSNLDVLKKRKQSLSQDREIPYKAQRMAELPQKKTIKTADIFCHSCGNKKDTDAKFCPLCGERFE